MNNYPPSYQLPAPNSTTALISLIAGILGFTALPFVGSVIAVITGHMALNEINRSGGQMGGRGAAIAGLVMGYAGVGLTIIGTICGILFFLGFCTLPFLTLPQNSSSLLLGLA